MGEEIQLKEEEIKVEAYEPFRAQLAQLREENQKAVFDYRSKAGNKAARSHVFKHRRIIANLEKARKGAKSWSLAYGRRVDSLAKEIKTEIEDMIEVHAAPLREIEAEEEARIQKIDGLIKQIIEYREIQFEGSNQAMEILRRVDKIPVDESEYQEFYEKALEEKKVTLNRLNEIVKHLEAREAEQAEIQRQKEEAERLAREAREKLIAQEAAEKARKEEADKAAKEKEEAMRREITLTMHVKQARQESAGAIKRAEEAEAKRVKEAKEAADRAEQARLAEQQRIKEAAAKARQEEIQRQKEEEQRAKEEQRLREEDRQHKRKINTAALSALIENGIPEEVAKQVITLIAKKMVPNVSILY